MFGSTEKDAHLQQMIGMQLWSSAVWAFGGNRKIFYIAIIIPRSTLARSVNAWQGCSFGSNFLRVDRTVQPFVEVSLQIGNR